MRKQKVPVLSNNRLAALMDAQRLIGELSAEVSHGPTSIWRVLHHASEYVDEQIAAELKPQRMSWLSRVFGGAS